jgi:hypothetical protein
VETLLCVYARGVEFDVCVEREGRKATLVVVCSFWNRDFRGGHKQLGVGFGSDSTRKFT